MRNILNRNIIVDNISFSGNSKSQLYTKIDKVKALLTDRGAKKGDLLKSRILILGMAPGSYHVKVTASSHVTKISGTEFPLRTNQTALKSSTQN